MKTNAQLKTQPAVLAGMSMHFHLGQLVALGDGHRGHISSIHYDAECGMPMATVVLCDPIILPAVAGRASVELWRQTVPMHDLHPLDERDHKMRVMYVALTQIHELLHRAPDPDTVARADGIAQRALGTVDTGR